MTRAMGAQTPNARALMRPRVGSELVHRVSQCITDRDKRICLDVYDHRFLTTHQALRLYFDSLTRARTRLLTLYQLRVLDRFRPHRKWGSFPWYYVLDEIGIQIVAALLGRDPKSLAYDRTKALNHVYSPRLLHMTEVNDFFTRIAEESRRHPQGIRLERWLSEKACRAAWKDYLRPDGFAIVKGPKGSVSFWLEVDGGTEIRPRLIEKLDRYSMVAEMDEAAGVILFCFPSRPREVSAREILVDCGIAVATGLLSDHMSDPFGRLWLPLGSDRRVTLVELRSSSSKRMSA